MIFWFTYSCAEVRELFHYFYFERKVCVYVIYLFTWFFRLWESKVWEYIPPERVYCFGLYNQNSVVLWCPVVWCEVQLEYPSDWKRYVVKASVFSWVLVVWESGCFVAFLEDGFCCLFVNEALWAYCVGDSFYVYVIRLCFYPNLVIGRCVKSRGIFPLEYFCFHVVYLVPAVQDFLYIVSTLRDQGILCLFWSNIVFSCNWWRWVLFITNIIIKSRRCWQQFKII